MGDAGEVFGWNGDSRDRSRAGVRLRAQTSQIGGQRPDRRAVGEVAREWFACCGMWLEKKLKNRVKAIGRGTTDGVSLAFGIAGPLLLPRGFKGLAGVGRLPSSAFAVCTSKWQDPAHYRSQADFR